MSLRANSLIQKLERRVKHLIDRRRGSGLSQRLHHYAIEGFVFKRLARFQILQHGGFEFAQAARKRHDLIELFAAQFDAARACGRLHLGHAIERKRGQRLRLDDLFDVGAGQTADGAKGRVP